MPRRKRYHVTLSESDRARLADVVAGRHPSRMITRAKVLLELDEAVGPVPDRRTVAARVGTSEHTVYLVAKAFTEHAGRVDDVIRRKRRADPPVRPKVTREVAAHVIELARSQPPAGHGRWTLRLLERRLAATEGLPALDHSTIGRLLKKAGHHLPM